LVSCLFSPNYFQMIMVFRFIFDFHQHFIHSIQMLIILHLYHFYLLSFDYHYDHQKYHLPILSRLQDLMKSDFDQFLLQIKFPHFNLQFPYFIPLLLYSENLIWRILKSSFDNLLHDTKKPLVLLHLNFLHCFPHCFHLYYHHYCPHYFPHFHYFNFFNFHHLNFFFLRFLPLPINLPFVHPNFLSIVQFYFEGLIDFHFHYCLNPLDLTLNII